MKTLLLPLLLFLLFVGCAAEESSDDGCGGDQPADAKGIRVKFVTTKGDFIMELYPDWSPKGVERMRTLVEAGYFTDVAVFRVLPGFVAQFGMHGDPATNKRWGDDAIQDEPVLQSNRAGTVTFATSGKNSRSNQLFINLGNNTNLDGMGFTPIGRVVKGMGTVLQFYSGYGEQASNAQGRIAKDGNVFLDKYFPELDKIKSASIVN
ncbi:MAG: peptidylprolyl isomerase [Planctomycetota bacterium]|jgi:cyclophilin family peptidyl-prolyl cis-trans isomerase